MFLSVRKGLCLFSTLFLALGVSACSVRYDESYSLVNKDGYLAADTPPEHETARANDAGAGSGDEPRRPAAAFFESNPEQKRFRLAPSLHDGSFFGLRYDDSARRRHPVEPSLGNPRTAPTIREQREARAIALAEDKLQKMGGIPQFDTNGGSSDPGRVKFIHAPNALGLDLDAAGNLNQTDGLPNALVLVVYHLSDRVMLDQLARTEDGMLKLLEGKPFDERSVKSVHTFQIQPGTRSELAVDRAEDGRYVALVAGYNRPDAMTSLRVVNYGIGQYRAAGATKISNSKSIYHPLPLNLHIRLKRSEMAVNERTKIYQNVQNSYKNRRKPDMYYEPVGAVDAEILTEVGESIAGSIW